MHYLSGLFILFFFIEKISFYTAEDIIIVYFANDFRKIVNLLLLSANCMARKYDNFSKKKIIYRKANNFSFIIS